MRCKRIKACDLHLPWVCVRLLYNYSESWKIMRWYRASDQVIGRLNVRLKDWTCGAHECLCKSDTARFRHSSVEECKILRNITWSIVVVNRDAYTRYIYHLTKQGKLKLINWTVIVKPCMIMWDTLYNTLAANHTRIRLQFILLHVPLKITRSSTQNVVKRPYQCSCVAFGKFSLYLLKSE